MRDSYQVGAGFDLYLQIIETARAIQAVWQYNTNLFDESTIAPMAGHFQQLLSSIAATPEKSVTELPLLTEKERHKLLVAWNDTQTDYPQDKCIHQLFSEQV